MTSLSYIAITPTRDEAANLQRLARCMLEQTARPKQWLIVDNGSTDETVAIARNLADRHSWISLFEIPGENIPTRGAPVVRAFHAGLSGARDDADIVVKLDADVAFEPSYFAAQLSAFELDPTLGISAGVCLEYQADGTWQAASVTRDHVRGAIRAYRRQCLNDVTPLEECMGWDGIDELKAQVRGWRTGTVRNLHFHHHRRLGARESNVARWLRQGKMSHYMGYRVSYLVVRALYHMPREPSAVAMLWGYATAALTSQPRCSDCAAISHLRKQQRAMALPTRIQEKLSHAE